MNLSISFALSPRHCASWLRRSGHACARALLLVLGLLAGAAQAAGVQAKDYVLGPGDVVRVNVFQNPDLATETRVSESGLLTFPLIGSVPVGGLSPQQAEAKVAQMLKDGGFVVQPQVNILVLQVRGNQVAVLGQVNRPGRYPLETFTTRLSDMLAQAGGISQNGADEVILTGLRDGKPIRQVVDVPEMFLKGELASDVVLEGGDILYVHRAPVFYIYGEVQRPGVYRLEREMNVVQGLAQGGGLSPRGTASGLRLHRRDAQGQVREVEPQSYDRLQPDDVIYVREALF